MINRQRKFTENPESTGGSFIKDPDISRIYGNIIGNIRPKPVSRMRIYAKSQSPNPPNEVRPSTSLGNQIPKQPITGKPTENKNLSKIYFRQ